MTRLMRELGAPLSEDASDESDTEEYTADGSWFNDCPGPPGAFGRS